MNKLNFELTDGFPCSNLVDFKLVQLNDKKEQLKLVLLLIFQASITNDAFRSLISTVEAKLQSQVNFFITPLFIMALGFFAVGQFAMKKMNLT